MTIFPGGKMILSTPSNLTVEQFENIRDLMREWADAEGNWPLVIGACQVQMAAVPLREVEVVRG